MQVIELKLGSAFRPVHATYLNGPIELDLLPWKDVLFDRGTQMSTPVTPPNPRDETGPALPSLPSLRDWHVDAFKEQAALLRAESKEFPNLHWVYITLDEPRPFSEIRPAIADLLRSLRLHLPLVNYWYAESSDRRSSVAAMSLQRLRFASEPRQHLDPPSISESHNQLAHRQLAERSLRAGLLVTDDLKAAANFFPAASERNYPALWGNLLWHIALARKPAELSSEVMEQPLGNGDMTVHVMSHVDAFEASARVIDHIVQSDDLRSAIAGFPQCKLAGVRNMQWLEARCGLTVHERKWPLDDDGCEVLDRAVELFPNVSDGVAVERLRRRLATRYELGEARSQFLPLAEAVRLSRNLNDGGRTTISDIPALPIVDAAETPAPVSAPELELGSSVELKGAKPPKKPADHEFRAWQLAQDDYKQSEIAEMLRGPLSMPDLSQGTVARWLKKVDKYYESVGRTQSRRRRRSKPKPIDPGKLEMGPVRKGKPRRRGES